MDANGSRKHKHRRGILSVIVSRYHFRGNTVEQGLNLVLSPLPLYYRRGRFQYSTAGNPRYSSRPHYRAALYFREVKIKVQGDNSRSEILHIVTARPWFTISKLLISQSDEYWATRNNFGTKCDF